MVWLTHLRFLSKKQFKVKGNLFYVSYMLVLCHIKKNSRQFLFTLNLNCCYFRFTKPVFIHLAKRARQQSGVAFVHLLIVSTFLSSEFGWLTNCVGFCHLFRINTIYLVEKQHIKHIYTEPISRKIYMFSPKVHKQP